MKHALMGHWGSNNAVSKVSVLILALGFLASCASKAPEASPPEAGANGANSTSSEMQGAAGEAARQPFRDIGLMKKKIPYALARIADPYADPTGPGCAWIRYELTQLSAALGTEVAVMPVASRATNAQKGTRFARETARDLIRSAGSSLMPARSIIRQLSGASDADELYGAAQERGMVRRGYLKGLSESRNCT
jgi:hypothetical protein